MTDATPRRSAYSRLLDRAMRILAMRDQSEQELRRKLGAVLPGKNDDEQAQATPEDIEKVIAWCHEQRYLDDDHFAERYIASRGRKGYGPQRIRQELQQKGISRTACDSAFAASEVDWEAQARDQAERKFGVPLPRTFPEKAKVQRFLLYRGYYMEDIQAIYRNFE
ncbi:recombination regulator RecX [Cronobacter turicensis]|uniref:recombination regulator RecX n=1 Tax=Cronobacter turicensis TaxID=413502 RepID=UPI001375F590|nr:recombination regulator RecX [Cronobacter turicensis]MEB8538738.1 recombination regulator RecX [Cronobacter sakazakii]EKM0526127.1 recombination regulator RecX [Cronobacter turicensis]ELQ5999109.1 recombination regulator RecX [Cronobacter turicensis]ELQ6128406.1 recombination regulator RecX [Cronobacter turicensis]ELY3552300.1 recombination regulator RecX [Cronobacter turicensis]